MALSLNSIQPATGANSKRKRVGRGMGSGRGKTSTRGEKGQKSRSGTSIRPGFEGGQMPLHRRLPKRGFNNKFRKEFTIVDLDDLSRFESGSKVDPAALKEKGIVKQVKAGIKVLGSGTLKHALTVEAHRFSKSAIQKITEAGGSTETIAG